MSIDWLIAGLGNPGKRYAHTRHNIGFDVLDAGLVHWGNVSFRLEARFQGELAKASCQGLNLLLVKPTTFMNLSGACVAPLARFYQLPPERILVVIDDVALPFGRLRVRPDGSAGGHNGLKSLIRELGNRQTFPRLRIGVGAPPEAGQLVDHVLSTFSAEEQMVLRTTVVPLCVQAIESVITAGIPATMTRFNQYCLGNDNDITQTRDAF